MQEQSELNKKELEELKQGQAEIAELKTELAKPKIEENPKSELEKLKQEQEESKNNRTAITKQQEKFVELPDIMDSSRLAILRHYFDQKTDAMYNGANVPSILSLVEDGFLIRIHNPNQQKNANLVIFKLNNEAKMLVYSHFEKMQNSGQPKAKTPGLSAEEREKWLADYGSGKISL